MHFVSETKLFIARHGATRCGSAVHNVKRISIIGPAMTVIDEKFRICLSLPLSSLSLFLSILHFSAHFRPSSSERALTRQFRSVRRTFPPLRSIRSLESSLGQSDLDGKGKEKRIHGNKSGDDRFRRLTGGQLFPHARQQLVEKYGRWRWSFPIVRPLRVSGELSPTQAFEDNTRSTRTSSFAETTVVAAALERVIERMRGYQAKWYMLAANCVGERYDFTVCRPGRAGKQRKGRSVGFDRAQFHVVAFTVLPTCMRAAESKTI